MTAGWREGGGGREEGEGRNEGGKKGGGGRDGGKLVYFTCVIWVPMNFDPQMSVINVTLLYLLMELPMATKTKLNYSCNGGDACV